MASCIQLFFLPYLGAYSLSIIHIAICSTPSNIALSTRFAPYRSDNLYTKDLDSSHDPLSSLLLLPDLPKRPRRSPKHNIRQSLSTNLTIGVT
ncbi:hypothetical protein DB88DRAFT_127818 [Papiliotrema laurentii]|uniref:Uncharacterized protein n=1 Tax=Papiliotrema laurentii TaxID=5418 RepID=A0AAD9FMX5_PAPLA|nr:hypothetical protein DB88DRAFT_130073 [Papiliotrema laurentii]KAK1920717.1 hypothetical protein DB88DRAFT_127818 [Papiliotrema laurentii]